jgi:hypothetical protein
VAPVRDRAECADELCLDARGRLLRVHAHLPVHLAAAFVSLYIRGSAVFGRRCSLRLVYNNNVSMYPLAWGIWLAVYLTV